MCIEILASFYWAANDGQITLAGVLLFRDGQVVRDLFFRSPCIGILNYRRSTYDNNKIKKIQVMKPFQ